MPMVGRKAFFYAKHMLVNSHSPGYFDTLFYNPCVFCFETHSPFIEFDLYWIGYIPILIHLKYFVVKDFVVSNELISCSGRGRTRPIRKDQGGVRHRPDKTGQAGPDIGPTSKGTGGDGGAMTPPLF